RPAQLLLCLVGLPAAGGQYLAQPKIIPVVLGLARYRRQGHLHCPRRVLVPQRDVRGQSLPLRRERRAALKLPYFLVRILITLPLVEQLHQLANDPRAPFAQIDGLLVVGDGLIETTFEDFQVGLGEEDSRPRGPTSGDRV